MCRIDLESILIEFLRQLNNLDYRKCCSDKCLPTAHIAVSIHVSEEEEQKDRQELYNAIGYSPDEEFIEYPKEVLFSDRYCIKLKGV